MNIHGTHTLTQTSPAQLWDGLLNPSLLIKVLPYAQNFTFMAPQERAILNLYGTFGLAEPHRIQVELSFENQKRPEQFSFNFLLQAEHDMGTISGEGHISLEAAANQTETILQYTISGEPQGVFKQPGDMLLETIGRGFMREMLTGLGSVLRQEELVSPLPATPPPPESSLKPWAVATASIFVPLTLLLVWYKLRSKQAKDVAE